MKSIQYMTLYATKTCSTNVIDAPCFPNVVPCTIEITLSVYASIMGCESKSIR
jgi:hypothetical protein